MIAYPPRVVGLDLSMTATGIARVDGSTVTTASKAAGDRRLLDIVAACTAASLTADLVVIEDLPVNAKSAGITGMVHGAVRCDLMVRGVPYVLVTPASLKSYATGKGNSGKPVMAVAAFKRAGLEFKDDNQCDAWWLRAMGLDQLGAPVAALPASQRAAMSKVNWPARDLLAAA